MFFEGGRATKWSENVFCQKADTSIFPIQTWRDFEQQFQVHFFLVNAGADTINALKSTSYQIATMLYGWLADTDSDVWYRAAQKID